MSLSFPFLPFADNDNDYAEDVVMATAAPPYPIPSSTRPPPPAELMLQSWHALERALSKNAFLSLIWVNFSLLLCVWKASVVGGGGGYSVCAWA